MVFAGSAFEVRQLAAALNDSKLRSAPLPQRQYKDKIFKKSKTFWVRMAST
jgi:hypothetical protein